MRRPRANASIRKVHVALSVLALVALTGAVSAEASPLENALGTHVFTGPSHPHPTSIFINPAAMGLALPGQHLYLGGISRISTVSVSKQIYDPQTDTFVQDTEVNDSLIVPGGMAAFFTSVADRGFFGVAVHAPYWEEFPGKNTALRYHSNGGRHTQTLFSMAGSLRANSRLFFGLGLSVGYTKFNLGLSRDSALEAGRATPRGTSSDCDGSPCGTENPAARQDYDISVGTSGLRNLFATQNLGLSLGISYRPYGKWWVSLAYVSPPGSIKPLTLAGQVKVLEAPRDGATQAQGRAEVSFEMPPSVSLSTVAPISPNFDLVAEIRWLNHSKNSGYDMRFFGGELEAQQDIPEWYPRYRGLNDTWRFQAGLEQSKGRRFRLGGRIRYETGDVNAQTVNAIQIHGQNLGAAVGLETRITDSLTFIAGYNGSWFPKIRSQSSLFDPRERLDCVDSMFDLNRCEAVRLGRATPTANGNYSRFSHSFSLSIQYNRF